MNLIGNFLETARRYGDRLAIIAGNGESISFSDLARRSGAFARAWSEAGLQKGDRVLVAMPVSLDLYAAIAGLWRLGAVIVFPEPALGLAGVRHAVNLTQPRALLTSGAYGLLRYLPQLWGVDLHLGLDGDKAGDALVDVVPDHGALISFTSGSTGLPKAIMRSHGFLAAQDAALDALIAPQRADETDLVAFPVFVIANLARGTTSVLPNWRLRKPDSARAENIVRLVGAHKITRALVPPFIGEVLAAAPALPLKTLLTGGGPVFPDLIERLTAVMPPEADIVSVYGSTEAEPIAWQRAREISATQWRAMVEGGGLLAGAPIAEIALRIVDDEILVTGDHVNKGYLGGRGDADNKRQIDGGIWHRTGDAGALDASGSLWLKGRASAGCNGLYPFEVEAPARLWPGVRHAAFLVLKGAPVLAIEGDAERLKAWQAAAADLGVFKTVAVRKMPLDRRHRSKIDYSALARQLQP
ncbi:MAG TPA: AMP-binding protein [Devosiaceae bacterium]|jgi:acyl-CoA synthetase (AMP-forming)/AMP-acid ligase II